MIPLNKTVPLHLNIYHENRKYYLFQDYKMHITFKWFTMILFMQLKLIE